MAAMPSAVEDLKDEQVPACLYWSVDQVADWIEELGFPNYKVCIKVIRIFHRYDDITDIILSVDHRGLLRFLFFFRVL